MTLSRSIVAHVVVVCGLAFWPVRATAQSSWSADLGFESGRVHGGEFRRDISDVLAIARVERRLLRVAGTDAYGGVSAEQPWIQSDITTICILDSRGQCLKRPPILHALALTVGVRRTIAHCLSLGVSAGPAEVFDTRWGRARGAFAGQVDVALRLFGPVYLTGGRRVVSWPADGASLHSYTEVYGLRLN